MKKQGLLAAVFAVVLAAYVALSVLLTTEWSAALWLGMAFFTFALTAFGTLSVVSAGRRHGAAFPMDLPALVLAGSYTAVVLAVNLLLGNLFRIDFTWFLSIQLICLAVFIVLLLLTQLARRSIRRQTESANRSIRVQQNTAAVLQKIYARLGALPQAAAKEALPRAEALLDAWRFSNFSAEADTADIDGEIQNQAAELSAEVEHMVEIGAEDAAPFVQRADRIHRLIADRNSAIQQSRGGI